MTSNLQRIYNIPKNVMRSINKPIFFDVSLRDGIQGIPKNRQDLVSLDEKINAFHSILLNYSPQKIEIGSIVNPKILPIMTDSLQLHSYAKNFIKSNATYKPDIFVVAPNKKSFNIGLKNGVKNFSFLTSLSNSFQTSNVNKTIYETMKDFEEVFNIISKAPENEFKTKLYISCLNSCPLEGIIDNDVAIHEILKYNKLFPLFDEYCLSDTCGTLKFEDYKYIIENCLFFGMPSSKISLHLHVNKENTEEVRQIINHSLDNNIVRFDVSMLEMGGCSLTLPPSKMLPNLSYETFNKIYSEYIDNRVNVL